MLYLTGPINGTTGYVSNTVIETKTGSKPGDQTDGGFSYEFHSPEGNCKIQNLDNPKKNDRESGAVDQFTGDMLGPCETFQPDEIYSVTITHWQGDGWRGEYLKISYGNKSFKCILGQMVDSMKSITFPCGVVGFI